MGMGLPGPALLGTPGAAGLDAGCQAGGGGFTDGPCAWGTDGLCAWALTVCAPGLLMIWALMCWPVQPPPVAEARAWVGIGTRADAVARWRMLG